MNNLLYIAKRVNAPLDYNSLGKFSFMAMYSAKLCVFVSTFLHGKTQL